MLWRFHLLSMGLPTNEVSFFELSECCWLGLFHYIINLKKEDKRSGDKKPLSESGEGEKYLKGDANKRTISCEFRFRLTDTISTILIFVSFFSSLVIVVSEDCRNGRLRVMCHCWHLCFLFFFFLSERFSIELLNPKLSLKNFSPTSSL